jgi:hypothetical protein
MFHLEGHARIEIKTELSAFRPQPKPVFPSIGVKTRMDLARGDQVPVDPAMAQTPGALEGAGQDPSLEKGGHRHDPPLSIRKKTDVRMRLNGVQVVLKGWQKISLMKRNWNRIILGTSQTLGNEKARKLHLPGFWGRQAS